MALVRPGEEDLHATDVGGMSNASAIGVRGCAIARRVPRATPKLDPARARGGRAAPWLVLLASRRDPQTWGLADRRRSRSAARKHIASHDLRTRCGMRHELLAVDAPCRRKAFSKRPQRKTGARACPDGRFDRMMTLSPRWSTSRTTAPMCWTRTMWTGTQAAAAVARAASAAAKTTVGRESDFRGRMALFMLEATWMALVG